MLPVDGGGDLVPGGKLAGIEQAKHFVEIAAAAHRIAQHRLDELVRPDQEDGAHRLVGGRGPAFGRPRRSEEHTSELQSLMSTSYAVFLLYETTPRTDQSSTTYRKSTRQNNNCQSP